VPHERDLFFENIRGQRLAATWHLPDCDTRRAAVIAHGLLSSKESSKHTEICGRLADAGVAALRFDFAGRGRSGGSLEQLTAAGQVEDLGAAVDEAASHGFTEIAVVGSSLGGAVSVLVAADTPLVSALVTMAAPARLPRSVRPTWEPIVDADRGETLGAAFFDDAVRHDIVAAAARIEVPWLILHGACDDVVPVADAKLFAAANPRARLVLHSEAGHRFLADEHREWLVSQVTRFVVK
jgi:pimeloyl-ACP methyl ester carboxylesterase